VVKDIECIKIAIRLLAMPILFTFAARQDWSRRGVQNAVCIAGIGVLIPLSMIHFAVNRLETGPVVLGLHSNSLGLSSFLAIFLAFLFRKNQGNNFFCWSLLLAGVGGVIFSVSRSVYFCCLFSVLAYGLIYLFRFQPLLLHFSFVVVIGGAIWLTTQLGAFLETSAAGQINQVSEQYLGKRLDSGRMKYWNAAYRQLRYALWFGRGTNARENWEFEGADGERIKLSVHNYYLAVLQETGVVGLTLVIGYLALIWNFLSRGRLHPEPRIAMALLLAMLVHQINEVTLTTGNFQLSVFIWVALGAMASFVPTTQSRSDQYPRGLEPG